MVQFNFYQREVNCKIVYYGPGLSGKTTNLKMVHQKTPGNHRGELTTIATEQDRTLFFDFMPIDLGSVSGMKTKLRLFTVPGQVFYNATRKLVLQGADGVIFVADSQENKLQDNLVSFKNLEENLRIHKLNIETIPLVLQWNKRDMPNILPVKILEEKINYLKVPSFEGVAVQGKGVFPTLKKCAALVLKSVISQANQLKDPEYSPTKVAIQKTPTAKEKTANRAKGPRLKPPVLKNPKVMGARPQVLGKKIQKKSTTNQNQNIEKICGKSFSGGSQFRSYPGSAGEKAGDRCGKRFQS